MFKIQLFRKTFEKLERVKTVYYQQFTDAASEFHKNLKFQRDVRYRILTSEISDRIFPICVSLAVKTSLNKKQFQKLYESVFWFTFTYVLPDRVYMDTDQYKDRNKGFTRSREYAAINGLLLKASDTVKVLKGYNKKQDEKKYPEMGEHFERLYPIAELELEVLIFSGKVKSWKDQFMLIEEQSSLLKQIKQIHNILGDDEATTFLTSFFEDLNHFCSLFYSIRNSAVADGVKIDPIDWEPKLEMTTLKTYLSDIRRDKGIFREKGRKKKKL